MKLAPDFEIVHFADEYILTPLGAQMDRFNGTVVLNEVSAFLMEKMKTDVTKEELVRLLTEEYEVDPDTAQADVEKAIEEMKKIGVIYD